MSYIYGLLTGAISALLNLMHSLTGNFGVAIILATIVIKIILLPLTLKQDRSMKSMKVLQPELEKIKQQYQNDPKMVNQKTMELYQKHKVNPMGGCLPLLIQLPILWALFGVLRDPANVPQESSFLWMQLINPDPYYILPVLNGVVSFFQQKLMGSSDNPQMKNMMYIFPLMMVFISYKMPAGLQIYWLTSSVASVVQQYLIMKKGD
ncbi:YidC/Oxa1 family membrane protein insertase [Fusobacterium sp.]|uniref:YidC/Oxa1 family membrane protein insertase n=1 Tax=Fusobacterium sp. TaxID=68766 RepID=UPI0025C560F7|nr:YidC/Oxa1 family membrane protein insertase [Fusobacterium sp.]